MLNVMAGVLAFAVSLALLSRAEALPAEETDHRRDLQRKVVAAAEEVTAALDQRRENGEALTPGFVESLVTTAERLSEARLELFTTDDQKRAEGRNLISRIKRCWPVMQEAGPAGARIRPQFRQIEYHVLTATRWAANIEAKCATPSPQTQPATQPTAVEVAAAAKEVYDLLVSREYFSPVEVDLRNQYSRHWADAERESARDRNGRIAAYENHLQRMKDLRELLEKNKDLISRVQTSMADFYIVEAKLLVEKEKTAK